jgi:hypothetical protein
VEKDKPKHKYGIERKVVSMTLRQFLYDNFGWDVYEWGEDEIRF